MSAAKFAKWDGVRRVCMSAAMALAMTGVFATSAIAQEADCNVIMASVTDPTAAAPQAPAEERRGFGAGLRNFVRDHGAQIGAVAAFALSNTVCQQGGNSEALCRIGVTAAGGLIGNQISRALVQADQRALLVQAHEAILDGRPHTLSLPDSHACATTTVAAETSTQQHPVTIAFAPNVTGTPSQLTAVGQNYETTRSTPVYADANTAAATIETLPANAPIMLMGNVPEASGWSMVGRGGVVIGYVRTQNLRASQQHGPAEYPGDENLVRVAQVNTAMTCRSSTNTVRGTDGHNIGTVTGTGCAGPDGLAVSV